MGGCLEYSNNIKGPGRLEWRELEDVGKEVTEDVLVRRLQLL